MPLLRRCDRLCYGSNDIRLQSTGSCHVLSRKRARSLAAVSTATLTTVLFKHGFRNTFIAGIHRLNPGGPAMVGPAYTLRYIPAREDLDHLGVFEDPAIRSAKASRNVRPAMYS